MCIRCQLFTSSEFLISLTNHGVSIFEKEFLRELQGSHVIDTNHSLWRSLVHVYRCIQAQAHTQIDTLNCTQLS